MNQRNRTEDSAHVGSTTMYNELSRVKTIVQALAVAERQREVTRSFSKNEHRHDDQTSTPLTLFAATLPLFALSSMTPESKTKWHEINSK